MFVVFSCCYVLSKCRKTTCILPPCRRKLWRASMPLHLPSLLCIIFLLLILLLLLLVLANRPPPFFSVFVSFVTCSHTLLTHHTLTHSYRSYVVRFCFSPPTRPTAEFWLWIHLRKRVEHVCAKKRVVIAMTTLAILLMPNSYHYPPVKQLRSCMCTLPRVVLPDRALCLPTFCHSL